MKYRIIRKKLKNDLLINLWIKSETDWNAALTNIEKKYPEDTDINNYDQLDYAAYIIGCNMIRFDWANVLKRAKKLGFGYKYINRYHNEQIK